MIEYSNNERLPKKSFIMLVLMAGEEGFEPPVLPYSNLRYDTDIS